MSTPPLVDNRKDVTGVTSTYQTVLLKDGNIWMAENYNYCANEDLCQTYMGYRDFMEDNRKDGVGLYYEWSAFTPAALPPGWHVPTIEEWKTMVNCYGGITNCYSALVKGGSSGLNLQLDGGTYFKNEGCRQLAMQGLGFYWSASEGDNTNFAALIMLDKDKTEASIKYIRKEYRFNVRLVKDK